MKGKLETILGREGISRRDALRIGFTAAGNDFVNPDDYTGGDRIGLLFLSLQHIFI